MAEKEEQVGFKRYSLVEIDLSITGAHQMLKKIYLVKRDISDVLICFGKSFHTLSSTGKVTGNYDTSM